MDRISKGEHNISELYDIYAKARPDLTEKYLRSVKLALELFQDAIGDRSIKTVGKEHLDEFRAEMLYRTRKRNGQIAPITGHAIDLYMRTLHSVFQIATDREWIAKNPFHKYPKTKIYKRMPRSYDPKEYKAYRNKAIEIYGEDYAMMLDIFLLTGLRDAEGCNMEWNWIKLNKGIILIPAEFTKKDYDRTVPLVPLLTANLKVLRKKGYSRPIPFSASELSHRWTHLRTGQRHHRKTYIGTNIPGKFHSLRATVETELEGQGINQNLIDELLGHGGKNVAAIHYNNYIRNLDVVRGGLRQISNTFRPDQRYVFADAI